MSQTGDALEHLTHNAKLNHAVLDGCATLEVAPCDWTQFLPAVSPGDAPVTKSPDGQPTAEPAARPEPEPVRSTIRTSNERIFWDLSKRRTAFSR